MGSNPARSLRSSASPKEPFANRQNAERVDSVTSMPEFAVVPTPRSVRNWFGLAGAQCRFADHRCAGSTIAHRGSCSGQDPQHSQGPYRLVTGTPGKLMPNLKDPGQVAGAYWLPEASRRHAQDLVTLEAGRLGRCHAPEVRQAEEDRHRGHSQVHRVLLAKADHAQEAETRH